MKTGTALAEDAKRDGSLLFFGFQDLFHFPMRCDKTMP